MKAYFDTNLLIAACVAAHPHHLQSLEVVRKVWKAEWVGCVSSHGLAEFYSMMTKVPFQPRILPVEAGRFLDDSILPYFEVVPLSREDYLAAFELCISSSLAGSIVFDALHVVCAQSSGCDRLYTFNIRHLRSLVSAEWQAKIVSP